MTWPLSDEQKYKLEAIEQEYNAKIISCRPTAPGSHHSANVEAIFKDSLMKDAHRTLDFVGLMRVSNFKRAVRDVFFFKGNGRT